MNCYGFKRVVSTPHMLKRLIKFDKDLIKDSFILCGACEMCAGCAEHDVNVSQLAASGRVCVALGGLKRKAKPVKIHEKDLLAKTRFLLRL